MRIMLSETEFTIFAVVRFLNSRLIRKTKRTGPSNVRWTFLTAGVFKRLGLTDDSPTSSGLRLQKSGPFLQEINRRGAAETAQ